jgi:hypothetical protein
MIGISFKSSNHAASTHLIGDTLAKSTYQIKDVVAHLMDLVISIVIQPEQDKDRSETFFTFLLSSLSECLFMHIHFENVMVIETDDEKSMIPPISARKMMKK